MFASFVKLILSPFRRRPSPESAPESRADKYAEDFPDILAQQREASQRRIDGFLRAVREARSAVRVSQEQLGSGAAPGSAMDAMDSEDTGLPAFKAVAVEAGQSLLALMPWYMQQGFIGYQNAAFIAQHWLIYKACATPVDDAIRNGYDITTADGEDLDAKALKIFKHWDRKLAIMGQLRDFGVKGRIFGIRIALFKVESDDPQYYEKPFNPDSVKPGKYRGITQIDPYWTAPILDADSSGVPSSDHFYEPTWWLIGSQRVHRTHLVIFRYAEPADVLKPLYLFGGIPLPQMIMERVYAAERTANEAPALALSKRTNVWLTNMKKVMADTAKATKLINWWISVRDNFGIKIGDKQEDDFKQFDTPLSEFDGLVMTQYGLVAATAGMPICKLLGTTPGGFAATGDYDESSYHELLESMEERDLSPFLSRHHQLVMLSEVKPKFPELADTEIVVDWHELDAMTHKEKADENLVKMQTDAAGIAAGSLTPQDSRKRLATDKESGYHGIGLDLELETLPLEDDPSEAAEAARSGGHAVVAAVREEEERDAP